MEVLTAIGADDPLVPQGFPAVTVMLPFWPSVPDVTATEVVPCRAVIAQPACTDGCHYLLYERTSASPRPAIRRPVCAITNTSASAPAPNGDVCNSPREQQRYLTM